MSSPTTSPQEVLRAIQYVEIAVEDPARVRAFLESTFGWTFEVIGPPDYEYLTFEMPGGLGGGGLTTPRSGQKVGVTPYVNVDNLEETRRVCEEKGAEIVVPITEAGDMGRFFWFAVPGAPPLGVWETAKQT